MARKKKTIIEESLPDDVNGVDQESSDIIIAYTKLYKLNAGARSFCFQTQEPVDEVAIQAQYPSGGKFVALEYNSLHEVLHTMHFDIEPKPMPVSSNGNGHSSIDMQNRMLMDELAWTRQMILSLIGGRNGSQPSTPVAELVQAVQGIHAIAPSGRDPVELLIKGMELGTKVNSSASGDWKSELIHTAKEVLTPAMEAFGAMKAQTMTQQQPTAVQALPSSNFLLKQGITWLKSKILSGLEPDLAIEWLIRSANDPQYQPFIATALQGTVDNFIAIDAEIGNEPYRTWFTTAIQILKDAYVEQSEQSANTSDLDGGNGNVADTSTDEKPSTRKPKVVKAG